MAKSRMLVEKVKLRSEYKPLPVAQEQIETWRFANDADWRELMKALADVYFYRVLGSASLPKCIPNVFKTYGSISQVIWIELMVGSGCFTRGSATKMADRGQGEACASACRIPILESVKPNTTVGEVTARIRRNRGQETNIIDVMPLEDDESEDATPSYCSPVAVTKKTEMSYPLATARRKIPTFAHQYTKQPVEEINVDETKTSPKIEYLGAASKQLGAGKEKKKIKNVNMQDFTMEDSQGVPIGINQRSNKRSSAGSSSSTTLPSYFELSPPPNSNTSGRRSIKTAIDKQVKATEIARQTIVADPISAEDRADPERLGKIRTDRLKKLNAIRMGSLGIAEELWDETIDSSEDNLALDITHIKHEPADPEQVKAAEDEIKQIAMTATAKSSGKTPAAPLKKKSDGNAKPESQILASFNDLAEIDMLDEQFQRDMKQDTQMLPGIPTVDLLDSPDNAEPSTKRRKTEEDVTGVESDEDALKAELAK